MKDPLFRKKVNFILKLGKALHSYGTNAPRIEASLKSLSESIGLKGHFFSTPTYLAISIDDGERQISRHVRTDPNSIHLGNLTRVDEIASAVSKEELSIDEASKQLSDLELVKYQSPHCLTVVAFSLLSLSLCVILKGNVNDLFISALLGALTGFLYIATITFKRIADLFEFLVAFIIATISYTSQKFIVDVNVDTIILASLIAIIPGLPFTISLIELAQKNLVSGTARLMGTLIDFFKISLGVIAGLESGKYLFGSLSSNSSHITNDLYLLPATLICAFCFTIIFEAKVKDGKWILLSCIISMTSYKVFSTLTHPIMTIFGTAFIIGLYSNAFAKFLEKPALLVMFPGIIFLVPGSVGFTSLNLIFQHKYTEGLTLAFDMIILAFSLILGLFFSNVFISPRKTI